ncbi:DUF4328 domain-containing protein [Actinokineospora iranica]|uniref:DUF4328 domain-containing protein n=1 Tax=Actinokineospora iranica TaxID=1271860 RepID=A0A1G6PDH0_9PSEU|nr:DUF4328 domain-containing protein [Actinokineospora iranica]SDC77614.1 protein of unknown function [Actinokineospora iranica]
MPPSPRFEWVATPPPGVGTPIAPRPRAPYLGPPAYRTPPRWGFPALAWRWPTSVPGIAESREEAIERVRGRARLAVSALWVLTVVTVLAAGAEVWRYILLLRSRTSALSGETVRFSDSLVVTGSVLAIAGGLIATGTVLSWLFVARRAAADAAGYDPARPDWHIVPGLLVPGLNLVVPGAMLAELEHAVLRRQAEARPTPTPLVRWWWAAWAAGGLLFAATIAWRFRDSVQAQADGVLLTATTNLAAAVVATLTALVITRLSTLLAPLDPTTLHLMRVIRVDGAPEPPLRATRPAGSTR